MEPLFLSPLRASLRLAQLPQTPTAILPTWRSRVSCWKLARSTSTGLAWIPTLPSALRRGWTQPTTCPWSDRPQQDWTKSQSTCSSSNKKMADRASLKRKLESLEDEGKKIRDVLWKLELEHRRHKDAEMQFFLQKRCARIRKFSKDCSTKCKFDNGFVAYFNVGTGSLGLYDGDRIGEFSAEYGMSLYVHSFTEWDDGPRRLAGLVELLPTIDQLVRVIFPAWLKASKELDVESLLMSRTLRWISKQVGGQWPDIITGNFPI